MTAFIELLLHPGTVVHAHPHASGTAADLALAAGLLAGLVLVTLISLSRAERVRDRGD